MQNFQKSETALRAEREEATRLRELIIEKTNSIPHHIINAPNVGVVMAFKKAAEKARSVATNQSHKHNLPKMQDAWNLISGYYK